MSRHVHGRRRRTVALPAAQDPQRTGQAAGEAAHGREKQARQAYHVGSAIVAEGLLTTLAP
jgi:hypothetical protein